MASVGVRLTAQLGHGISWEKLNVEVVQKLAS